MTELTQAEIKRRTGLLAQARQLVNKEYIARRSEQHQHWIANSESSWRTNGALLPYPAGILYPSEDEIVAKALELYNASAPQAAPTSTHLPLPEVPPMSAATFNPELTATVTAQLQEASAATPLAVIDIPVSSPWVNYLQEPELTPVVVEPEVIAAPEVIEPEIVVEAEPEVAEPEPETVVVAADDVQTTVAKNSLLRNVLSGWLQKNKDKET